MTLAERFERNWTVEELEEHIEYCKMRLIAIGEWDKGKRYYEEEIEWAKSLIADKVILDETDSEIQEFKRLVKE